MRELPRDLLTACLSMGSLMFGATIDQETARAMSERFDSIDPYKTKHSQPTFGYKPHSYGASNREFSYYTVTGEQKTFFPFDEQKQMNSEKYLNLPKEDWFLARAEYEGHVPRRLSRITTRNLDPGQYVNERLVGELKARLMTQRGVKITDVLQEIDGEEEAEIEPEALPQINKPKIPNARRTGRRRFVEE